MKKLIALISVWLVLFSLILSAATGYAANPIDVERPCSLSIEYSYSGEAFSGLEISTYKIADVLEDGTYILTETFADYSVNIYGITSQSEWKSVVSTLSSYIAADSIKPTYKAITNEKGCAEFAGIDAGMYLTLETKTTSGEAIITFESFLSVVPTPMDEGEHLYDVTSRPKCSSYTPTKAEIEYKIVKQWKDNGGSYGRPASVEIDVLKNGKVYTSVTLNAENNWSYSWKCEDDGSKWQAVERNISGDYKASVVYDGTSIVVTNTIQKTPVDPIPPQTNDINRTEPYIISMSVSGILLMLIALVMKRREQ